MRLIVILLTGMFAFQILDIPPSRNMSSSHTCCGRAICTCKHVKGAQCPLRKKMPARAHILSQAEKHKILEMNSGKSCHLQKPKALQAPQTVKPVKPFSGLAFTQAPCGKNTEKSALPQYSKDFLSPAPALKESFIKEGVMPSLFTDALFLVREHGIYHPPRTLSFSH